MGRLYLVLLILTAFVAYSMISPAALAWNATLSLGCVHPVYPDSDVQYPVYVKNIGSQPMRVDSLSLQFDWMPQSLLAADVPQVLGSGQTYSFLFSIHIPNGITTDAEHGATMTIYGSDPNTSGNWIPNNQPYTAQFSCPVSPRPVQLAYSAQLTWFPNPITAGQTEDFGVIIKDQGSAPFRVTHVQFSTDWGATYDDSTSSDVPQIVQPGSSYTFHFSVPIPASTAVGSHVFQTMFWGDLPTSQGLWSNDIQVTLGQMNLQIQEQQTTPGGFTSVITMPTQYLTCDQSNCYIVMNSSTIGTITNSVPYPNPSSPWGLLEAILAIIVIVGVLTTLYKYWPRKARAK
jgi:hypothetical protein